MNIESKVFLQLEKVQPSESKKVELSLIGDIASLTDVLGGINDTVEKTGEEMMKLQEIIDREGRRSLLAFQDASKVYDKLEAMFKELGLPDAPTNDPKVRALLKEMDRVLIYRKRYNF